MILWVFIPNVSQPIRLGLAQRLTGQVANGDLARANFSGDYNPTILRTEKVSGEDHYVLELLAVDRSVTYHRVLLWVNKSNLPPSQGRVLLTFKPADEILRLRRLSRHGRQAPPDRLVMEDAGSSAAIESVLEYEDMKLRDLPDKVFSKDYLKKLQ